MALNIYDEISSNKRKTAIIMTLFVVVISMLGYFLGEIFIGRGSGYGIMFFAFIFSICSSISSYYFSDKMVLAISGAKKVSREDAPQIYGILENLCIGSGLKKIPVLYLIDDTAPNAFATGRDPDHAAVAVTQGLIDKLSKREIEAVLAHELSHVKNYDIRLMAVTAILVGSVSLIANIVLRGRLFSSSDDNRKGGGILIIIGILLVILSPVIAQLIQLAVSRSREYLADASAALLTRDPEGLAMALDKISHDSEPLEVANEATAHMYISNPLKSGTNSTWFANMFNTHPPVEERITRLRAM